MKNAPEAWMRGPIPYIPPLLMPVAHALVGVREELSALVAELPREVLWARPAGVASVGFHLLHAAGSLDRLFTYARGEALSDAQREALARESDGSLEPDGATLADHIHRAVESALAQLRATEPDSLLEPRGVGRQQLPSNVLGLLFHAAEHFQRHAGQAVTTARIARAQQPPAI
jgi:hypothetical protein